MGNTLIRDATVVTMNEQWDVIRGDVRIKDDRIVGIGGAFGEEGFVPDEIIEASGKVVIPGFVQTHVHLCQTLFRGRADDMELMDWLRTRIWPLEAAHDEQSVYISALLGIGELIQSGTTTLLDMETVHHTDAAFRAMAESGIRAISGKVMMDRSGEHIPPALQERTEQSIEDSVALLERWHGYDGGRLQYAFCPRFVVSCTEELLIAVRDLAERYQVLVHTHAAENRGEIELVERDTGMRNVVYLDHIGLATPRLVLAHSIWLDDAERDIIKRKGVKVTHCPGSNLKLASGIAGVPGLLASGVQVGLGADGAPCNNNLDMFQEMRLTAMIHKVQHGPTAMDARTVLRMATMGGAEVLGLERMIGSIEVGKKADLVMLDLNKFHTFPSHDADIYSRVVYAAGRGDVDTVWIDGRIVMRSRIVTTINEAAVLQESDVAISRLIGRMA
ncbi:5'-deoxyadenosine deaminase [Paenibacillus xylaniclasticus]|uniref:5'-deoxyadenosine deaminase n=1 Tax=Paenibacillus xylaniclasticus TaxID=588083 RepID=UPI000FD7FD49|nr:MULTISPECIES: 5'-deoxyadenosine deaminase [Paenibacillus]GFN33675.1 5-methylthioadenosine/S-adenosylhomocysteine deaminase [Paenibacillus curdlanolyticus]